MARDRFVKPEITRLKISDGDWIDVKTELDAGDQRRQDVLALVPTVIEGKVIDRVDWSQYEILRTQLWLSDWSFTKVENEKIVSVPLSLDAIRALNIETFEEVNNAIFKHIMAGLAEKKRKNLLRPESSPVLPFVDAPTSTS